MTSAQRCEDLKRLARPAACYGNILAAQFVHPHCYTGEAIAAGHAQKQNTAVRITQKKADPNGSAFVYNCDYNYLLITTFLVA